MGMDLKFVRITYLKHKQHLTKDLTSPMWDSLVGPTYSPGPML